MKRALVINEGFSENFGDQGIQFAMDALCKEYGFICLFEDFSGNSISPGRCGDFVYRRSSVPAARLRFVPIYMKLLVRKFLWFLKNFFRVFKAVIVDKPHVVIFGGGQMLQENGMFPFYFRIWVGFIRIHNLFRYCPYSFFSVGVGRFKTLRKGVLSDVIRGSSNCIVRDNISANRLLSAGFDVQVCPDAVFGLPSSSLVDQCLDEPTLVNHNGYIVVTVPSRLHFLKNASLDDLDVMYSWFQSRVFDALNRGNDVFLLPSTCSDLHESHVFKDSLEKLGIDMDRVFIADCKSFNSWLTYIKYAKHVYSGRMHTLIFGCTLNVAVTAYAYSPKLKAFESDHLSTKPNLENLRQEVLESFGNMLSG